MRNFKKLQMRRLKRYCTVKVQKKNLKLFQNCVLFFHPKKVECQTIIQEQRKTKSN